MTNQINGNEEQILSLLNALRNKLSPKFEQCTGISSSRLEILRELCQVGEINQSMLQKRINIDNAAITRHLKQLEANGMVLRRKNPVDNRETFVTLSEEGKERIQGYKNERDSFVNQMLQGFSQNEIQQLENYLKRMNHNI